ncbi:hypothetical protein MUO14_11025 [Halobacillus shinanisalinarum]|uniref:Uncharacterized protein n=1 Tax=Halobacillus shinanisalinarum TaxID=2932258 RepID=A0ABY4H4M4_9BACI|nr:CBO0543 family protein [Halobacillus shinanisalinarum]UOQ95411.1 hypothetical protein MUO14_11025 [Halobacillus shinanisalinarum]
MKDKIIIFFMTSYIATVAGVIVVEEKMIDYPVNLFSQYFSSSLLYEMILVPIVCIYFYQTTFHSSYSRIALQCAIYTSILTFNRSPS